MAMYAIGLTPLLNMMLEAVIGASMVAFTDDLTSLGTERVTTTFNNPKNLG